MIVHLEQQMKRLETEAERLRTKLAIQVTRKGDEEQRRDEGKKEKRTKSRKRREQGEAERGEGKDQTEDYGEDSKSGEGEAEVTFLSLLSFCVRILLYTNQRFLRLPRLLPLPPLQAKRQHYVSSFLRRKSSSSSLKQSSVRCKVSRLHAKTQLRHRRLRCSAQISASWE